MGTDIYSTLLNINSNLNENDTYFKELYIYGSDQVVLQANTFEDIKSTEITFMNFYKLTLVNIDAFNGTENLIKKLLIANTPLVDFTHNDTTYNKYGIFLAINKLIELDELYLQNTSIKVIPDNAFVNTTKLQVIQFKGPTEQIGASAFSKLTQLKRLMLLDHKLKHLSNMAFAFDTSLVTLNITLYPEFGYEFDMNNLSKDVYTGIKRPIKLDISMNKLAYLNESVYGHFIKQNSKNYVVKFNLDCQDCRNLWLWNRKYVKQVHGIGCQGTWFYDHKIFLNCSSPNKGYHARPVEILYLFNIITIFMFAKIYNLL